MAVHVRVVHVTSGWTILVKDMGSLAPKVKDASVVQSIVSAVIDVIRCLEADDLMATMVAIAEVVAQATNILKVASENDFGGGVLSSTFVLCTTGNDCASASANDDDAVP